MYPKFKMVQIGSVHNEIVILLYIDLLLLLLLLFHKIEFEHRLVSGEPLKPVPDVTLIF
jgi:hypothetical protein